MKNIYSIICILIICSCNPKKEIENNSKEAINSTLKATSIILLGTIQDAGSPHIACKKNCCKDLFINPDKNRKVISLGLFNKETRKKYLFEATPDISSQLKSLKNYGVDSQQEMPDGIFLTHAHIGHYAGLMYLGKEATDAKEVMVYAMPKMKVFLETNGPWDQLVTRKNIVLSPIKNEETISLSENLEVTPVIVPHRDEYSETVGYTIKGPNKSALFIPDIDKWEKWDKDIVEEIKKVDYAFLDATFYSGEELNNRDISQIPHPFIIESIKKFEHLDQKEKEKIIFIHFNHTNPIINPNSTESKTVINKGFRIGQLHDTFEL